MKGFRWLWVSTLLWSSASAGPALESVTFGPSAEGFTVHIGNGDLPKVFTLTNPPRLVVDVPVTSGLPDAPRLHRVAVDRWGIRAFRTSPFGSDPARPVTRLVFELDKTPLWEIEREDGAIRLAVATGVGGIGAPVVVGKPMNVASTRTSTMPELRHEMDPPSEATSAPPPPSTTTDILSRNVNRPPRDVVDARQNRLWQRRASELIALAEVHWAAGNHRDGLESLHRVFEYYPSGEHVRTARHLASRFLCELHMGRDAAEHFIALFEEPETSDSLLTVAAHTFIDCQLDPANGVALLRAFGRLKERLTDESLVTTVGSRIGILLAESGQELDRAVDLLSEGIAANPDANEAAGLHRALGRSHEREGKLIRAAESYLFAARLLRALDPDASLRDRSRAADNFFQGGDLERAAEQYRVVAGVTEVPPELRSWALFQQANCFYRTRRYGEAAETYQALRATFPESYWSSQAEIRLAVLEESGLGG